MAEKKKKRGKKLIIIAFVVAVLAAMGLGVMAVYDRGLTREGILDKAQRALLAQQFPKAANLVREVLKTDPDNYLAREMLMQALHRGKDYEGCKEAGKRFLEDGPGNEYAAIILCRIAVQEGDMARGEELAHTLADTHPSFAYQVRALIQDHRGIVRNDWRMRLAAASTMRTLATIAESEDIRAEALIFATTVTMEVLPFVPAGRTRLRESLEEDLEHAVTLVSQARQKSNTYPADLAMGRIHILSEDEGQAATGAQVLRGFSTGANRNDQAVTALALYHIRRAEWREAVDLARTIEDSYLWLRVLWYLREQEQHDVALEILGSGAQAGSPERSLARADILFRTKDPARMAEGRSILEELVKDREAGTDILLRALIQLAVNTDLETARRIAIEAGLQNNKDKRITAVFASLLSASDGEKELALELVEQLARDTEGAVESRQMIDYLSGNPEAVAHYLDTQIAKGGEAGLGHRMRRALTLLARAGAEKDDAAGKLLRERVVTDLEAALADKAASKASLVLSFDMAARLGKAELAGRLVGRALSMEGAPHSLDALFLRLAHQAPERDVLEKFLAGVRAIAPKTAAPEFLGAIADAAETRLEDKGAVLKALDAAAQQPGSRRPALQLSVLIAVDMGDLELSEKRARALVDEYPEDTAGRDLYAGVLLKNSKPEEVLELYRDRGRKSAVSYTRIVGALVALDRTDEAVREAKEALKVHPKALPVYAILAQVYVKRGERRKALSVLSIAPATNPGILHWRAHLLFELGDDSFAQQIYEGLLVLSEFKDARAWEGLYKVLVRTDRQDEFIVLSARALQSPKVEMDSGLQSDIHFMRAAALEARGQLHEALADYESAIALNEDSIGPLNNCAWLIATVAQARIADARKHIDRALQLKPGDAALLDTAAEVASVMGKHDEAIQRIDSALALHPKGKAAKYLMHRVRILERAKRNDEAMRVLERILTDFSESMQAAEAREIMERIKADKAHEESEGPEPGGDG